MGLDMGLRTRWRAELDSESEDNVSAPRPRPGWVILGDGKRAELAGPGARLGTRLIDGLLLGLASAVAAFFGLYLGLIFPSEAPGLEALSEFILWPIGAVFVTFVLAAFIEGSMVKSRGQTFGKMAVGIKVVRADNGQCPGWGASIKRWVVPWLVPLLFLLVAFPIALLTIVVYFLDVWG